MTDIPKLYLIGTIGTSFWEEGYTLKDVTDFVENNKKADEIEIYIDSMGGSVSDGLAIYDYLKSVDKKVKTISLNSNSIATIIFLAGEERLVSENSDFFIHLPWLYPDRSNSDDLTLTAEKLKEIENKLINIYNSITGIEKDELRDYMAEEKNFTSDEAVEFGFATGKLEQIKAFAVVGNQDLNQKETHKTLKNINMGIKSIEQKIKDMFQSSKDDEIKSFVTTLKDGRQINVQTKELKLDIGKKVTYDDGTSLEEGEYELKDSTYITINSNSIISEIKTPEPDESYDSLINSLVDIIASQKEELKFIKGEIETIKNSTSSNFTPPLNDDEEEVINEKNSYKIPMTGINKRLEQSKMYRQDKWNLK